MDSGLRVALRVRHPAREMLRRALASMLSLYRNYIARGKDISFARGTQIEIDAVSSLGAKMPVR